MILAIYFYQWFLLHMIAILTLHFVLGFLTTNPTSKMYENASQDCGVWRMTV